MFPSKAAQQRLEVIASGDLYAAIPLLLGSSKTVETLCRQVGILPMPPSYATQYFPRFVLSESCDVVVLRREGHGKLDPLCF